MNEKAFTWCPFMDLECMYECALNNGEKCAMERIAEQLDKADDKADEIRDAIYGAAGMN